MTRLGVTNLLVDDETTSSLQVSWDIDDADVEEYRVTYVSERGDREEESVRSHTHTVYWSYYPCEDLLVT